MSTSVEFNWNKLLMELLYGKIINIIKENDGIHIFNEGNSVFFLCNNKVYAFGKKHDCIDCKGDAIVPIEVQNLENIGIEALCTGNMHAVLLDRNGSVFCWGNNQYGQIGCGTCANQLVRVPHKLNLSNIVHISCGAWITLALSRENEVWLWGNMIYGSNSTQWVPNKVNLPSNIKCISAGVCHATVLSEDGKVFTWGSSVALENRTNKNVTEPTQVNLLRKVQNVVAWGNYNFLITSNKEWYFTCGTETNLCSLEPFNHKCGEITTTAAVYSQSRVAVINSEGNVYQIDTESNNNSISFKVKQFNGCIYKLFVKTPSLQSNEHLLCRKGTGIMPQIKNEDLYIKVSTLFNNNNYSDITLKLTNDLINAHKIILAQKSDYFKKLFEDDTEGPLKEIDVSNFNSQSYKAYIKYLYTASLDIEIEHLPELYSLADQHNDEKLKNLCLKMWLKAMNRHNIVRLYHAAYLLKIEPLMKACVSLISFHLNNILISEDLNELSLTEKYSLVTAAVLHLSN